MKQKEKSSLKQMVPELRFPEFAYAGNWEEKKLGDICLLKAGQFISASEIKESFIDGLFPCYGGNGIRGFTNSYTHEGSYSLVGRQGALCGNVNYVKGKFHATEHALVCIPDKGIDNFWLYYHLFKMNLNQYATGQAQPGLSVDNLVKLSICYPKLIPEQQKIADCLSSLDEVISLESQKLQSLQSYKKGLLQSLFPAEGEMVPKLRFPEFVGKGDWEERKLGDVAQFINERVGDRKVTLMSITSGVGLESQMRKFGREIAGNSYRNYIMIRKGDFAYNKSSTKIFPEGQISMLDSEEVGAVPNSIFVCFKVNRSVCDINYLNYLFSKNIHGIWLRNFISVGARAHGSLNIDNKYIVAIPIPLPSLPEQQKIADCLSSLDALIQEQADRVEKLKFHKKGLLQGLFPVMGE